MTEPTSNDPKPDLKGAGLSATGKTADQFSPGDDAPGSTYGDPGGTGALDKEVVGAGDETESAEPEASPS